MANKLYNDTSVKAIADAIRAKNGKTDTYTVAEMAGAINDIPAGGSAPSLQSKSVTYTSNGTATITPDAGYDGLSGVDVTVDVSGGGGSNINFEFGAFTPVSDIRTITISHTLGKIPDIIFFRADTVPGGSYNRFSLSIKKFDDGGFDYSAADSKGYNISLNGFGSRWSANDNTRYGSDESNIIDSITNTDFTIGSYSNTSVGCKAGVTYYWIAVAE